VAKRLAERPIETNRRSPVSFATRHFKPYSEGPA